jgi:hypothetical protein
VSHLEQQPGAELARAAFQQHRQRRADGRLETPWRPRVHPGDIDAISGVTFEPSRPRLLDPGPEQLVVQIIVLVDVEVPNLVVLGPLRGHGSRDVPRTKCGCTSLV